MSLKRLLRSLICLGIMIMLSLNVGGMHCLAAATNTIRYITAQTDAVTVLFGEVQVSCSVESADGETFTVTNTSSIPAYIRVRIVGNWVDPQGDIYSVQPTYNVSTTDPNWQSYENYYYYTIPVEVDGTINLNVAPKEDAPTANHSFRAGVLAEAIQAAPSKAVKEAWMLQADADGKLSPAPAMFRMFRMTDEIAVVDTTELYNINILNWEKAELDPYNLEYLMDGSLAYYLSAPERYKLPETIDLFINGEHYIVDLLGENNPDGITYYATTGMLIISPSILPYGEIGLLFAGDGVKLRPEINLDVFDLMNIRATDISGTYAGSPDAELVDEEGNMVLFLEAEDGYYLSGRIYLNVNGEDLSFDMSGEDMPYGVSYVGGILTISEEILLGGMNSVTVAGVAEEIIEIPDTEAIPDDEDEEEDEANNGSSGSGNGDGNGDNDDDNTDDDNTGDGNDNVGDGVPDVPPAPDSGDNNDNTGDGNDNVGDSVPDVPPAPDSGDNNDNTGDGNDNVGDGVPDVPPAPDSGDNNDNTGDGNDNVGDGVPDVPPAPDSGDNNDNTGDGNDNVGDGVPDVPPAPDSGDNNDNTEGITPDSGSTDSGNDSNGNAGGDTGSDAPDAPPAPAPTPAPTPAPAPDSGDNGTTPSGGNDAPAPTPSAPSDGGSDGGESAPTA